MPRILRRSLRICIAAFALCLGTSDRADAQQTILNVPSHDVLEAGHTIVEFYQIFRVWSPGFFVMTPRIIRGIGHNAEMGFAIQDIGFIADHHERFVLALKRLDTLSQNPLYTISEGLTASSPLNKSDQSGLLLYASASTKPDSNLRLTLGLFGGLGGITGRTTAAGGLLAGVEYHLLDDVDLQADFLTGSSALGYFSIGAVFSLDQNISVLTAFQRANAADSGSVIRTAVRYQF